MTAFAPAGPTVTIAVTAASADQPIVRGSPVLLLQNGGANPCFVLWGAGVQTALLTSMPVLAGQTIAVNPGAATHIAAICGGALTTTLYATPGTGNVTGGD